MFYSLCYFIVPAWLQSVREERSGRNFSFVGNKRKPNFLSSPLWWPVTVQNTAASISPRFRDESCVLGSKQESEVWKLNLFSEIWKQKHPSQIKYNNLVLKGNSANFCTTALIILIFQYKGSIVPKSLAWTHFTSLQHEWNRLQWKQCNLPRQILHQNQSTTSSSFGHLKAQAITQRAQIHFR